MSLLLHDRLYQCFANNQELMAKVKCITDSPQANTPTPYIEVGETYEGNGELVDNSCAAVVVAFHIWSNYKGRKEILEIRDLLVKAMPDWCLFESFSVEQYSKDPLWWHGIFEIRFFD